MLSKTKKIILFSAIILAIVIAIVLIVGLRNAEPGQSPDTEPETQTAVPTNPIIYDYTRTSSENWEDSAWVGQTEKESIRVIHFVKEKPVDINPQYAWVFDGFTCYLEIDEVFFVIGADMLKIERDSMARAFAGFPNLESIKGLEKIEFENVGIIDGMLQDNPKLKEIDIAKCHFHNVISADGLFANCSSLESIDLSQLEMRKLKNASRMFYECKRLEELSLPIMPNIEYADETLLGVGNGSDYFCTLRGQLDLTNCISAIGLLQNTRFEHYNFVENFKTDKLENASRMFKQAAIDTMNLTNWKTDNLKNVSEMFADVDMLETVNLNGWNLPKISDMSKMFFDCYNLKTVSLQFVNTNKKIKSTQSMFQNCDMLQTIDLLSFNGAQIGSTIEMFKNCTTLQTILCTGMQTDVSDRMFENCSMLAGKIPFDINVIDATYANAEGYFRNEE